MRMTSMAGVSLPNFSAQLMLDTLRDGGFDTDDAIARSGIPRILIEDPKGVITGTQELAFQRAFHAATVNRPDLWVELGSRFRLLSHGHSAFGLALATAANLQQMFELVVDTDHLHYTLCGSYLLYAPDGALTGFGTDLSEVPADLRQFTLVRDFAATVPIFRDLWGSDFPFEAIETAISPAYARYIQPLVQGRVHTGSAVNRWHWSAPMAGRSLQHSNAQLHDRQRVECQALIDSALGSGETLSALKHFLAQHGTSLPIAAIARAMGMSPRTFQRRLAEKGYTYREFVEQWRYDTACKLLLATNDQVASIAWKVGYANISSFNHAFKRRAGLTPSVFRRGHPA